MGIDDRIREELPLFRVWIGQNKMRFAISVLLGFAAGLIARSIL